MTTEQIDSFAYHITEDFAEEVQAADALITDVSEEAFLIMHLIFWNVQKKQLVSFGFNNRRESRY